MHVIDSSLWIEAMIGSPMGQTIMPQIRQTEECVVPTLVQHEVYKWLSRERSQDEVDSFVAFSITCRVVPLDTTIALRAADLAMQFRLHASDAIIYATALATGAKLLTCDAHFSGLEEVVYSSKL